MAQMGDKLFVFLTGYVVKSGIGIATSATNSCTRQQSAAFICRNYLPIAARVSISINFTYPQQHLYMSAAADM